MTDRPAPVVVEKSLSRISLRLAVDEYHFFFSSAMPRVARNWPKLLMVWRTSFQSTVPFQVAAPADGTATVGTRPRARVRQPSARARAPGVPVLDRTPSDAPRPPAASAIVFTPLGSPVFLNSLARGPPVVQGQNRLAGSSASVQQVGAVVGDAVDPGVDRAQPR